MNWKSILSRTKAEIFENFWKLGNWNCQSNYIAKSVTLKPCKRRYKTNTQSVTRTVTRKYCLNGLNVCQNVFTSTLGINASRIEYCLKSKAKFGICSPDGRGKHNPRKNEEETIKSTQEFLNRFPKYHSHYSQVKRYYFNPALSKGKIHQLYIKKMEARNKKCVSYLTFNKVIKEYNVGICVTKKGYMSDLW